jgi:hypothetical protein
MTELVSGYYFVRARPGGKWHISKARTDERFWRWALCGEWGRPVTGEPPTPAHICTRCRRAYEKARQQAEAGGAHD